MRDYLIRRLLLMIPTLLGVTFVVFLITRITPGGPMEKALQAAMVKATSGSGGAGARDGGGALSEEQKQRMSEYFGQDVPFLRAWATWLGVWPREVDKIRESAPAGTATPLTLRRLLPRDQWRGNNAFETIPALVTTDERLVHKDTNAPIPDWRLRFETTDGLRRAVVYRHRFSGIIHGNFGLSTRYNEDVLHLIGGRLPVSCFYAAATVILVYLICIPLGILKAIKHRTTVDHLSSALIFAGYAIPGFAMASLLVVFMAGRLGWFPIGGFVSENFSALSFGGKITDLLHHAVLPLFCYLIGEFAMLTMLMKNNLMDNLAADYVRTAVAKGNSFRRAVFAHAVRNSIIPVMTTVGQRVVLFVSGSILIEKIFDIDGFGLLSFSAIIDRDYMLIMAIFTLTALVTMIGNVLSDFLVAAVDPRIRFD
jgi:microcin C transport system permease protein